MPSRTRHRALRIAAWGAVTLAAALVVAYAALQVDAVGTSVFRAVAARVAPEDVRLDAARVSGSWVRGLTLADVRFADAVRGIRLQADTVRVGYAPWRWRWGRIRVDGADVVGLRLRLSSGGEAASPGDESPHPDSTAPPAGPAGTAWEVELARLDLRPGPGDEAAAPETSEAFRVSEVHGRIEGLRAGPGVRVEAWRLGAAFAPAGLPDGWGTVQAAGDLSESGVRLDTVALSSPRSRVSGRGRVPFDGTVLQPGGLSWNLEATPLVLGDLEGLADVPGVLAGDSLVLRTSSAPAGDSAEVVLEASTSAGAVVAAQMTWGRSGSRWGGRATATVGGLDPRRYLGDSAPEGPVRGTLEGAGAGRWESGLQSLDASLGVDAAAPGLTLRAQGRVLRRADGPEGAGRDSLVLDVDTLRWADRAARGGRVTAARTRDGAVDWALDLLPAPAGRIRGRGDLAGLGAGDPLRYSARLRIDDLVEPSSRSRLSGDIRLEGRGTSTLDVRSSVVLGASEVAGWPVDTLEAEVAWAGEAGETTGTLSGPRGQLSWVIDGRATEAGGRIEVTSLVVDSLRPLPRDTSASRPPLRLTGRADGAVTWEGPPVNVADPERLVGSARFLLTGVGAGVEAVDSIVGDATWERGEVDAHLFASLPDEAGLELRGRGSLLDSLDLRISDGFLRDLDLSLFLPAAPPTELNGSLEGRIARRAGDSLPRVDVVAALGPSTVRQDTVRGVDAELRLDPDTLSGVVIAEMGGGTVTATLAGPGAAQLERWTLDADAVLPRLGGFLGQPDTAIALSGHLTARADGPGSTAVDLAITHARGWGVQVDSGIVRGGLTRQVLQVDTLLVHSSVARIEGGGGIPATVLGMGAGTGAAVDRRMTVEVTVPDSVAPITRGNTIVQLGPSTARAQADCRGDRCRIEGDAALGRILAGSNSMLSGTAAFSGRLEPGRQLEEGRLTVIVDGVRTPAVDVLASTLQATWDGSEARIVADATLDERRSARLEVRADPNPERRRVTLDRIDLVLDRDAWTLSRPATVALSPEGLVLDSLEVTAAEQRILAYARTTERGRDLVLEVDSLRIGAVSDLLERPGLGGRISGAFELRRSDEVASLVGRLDANVLQDGAPLHRLRVDALGTADTLTVEGRMLDADGRPRATVDLSSTFERLADADWRAVLVADSIPLAWAGVYAPVDLVREVDGVLDGRLEARSDTAGLQVEGPVRVSGGRVVVPATDVLYSEIELTADARGRSLEIESFGVVSRGRAQAAGTLTFPEGGGAIGVDVSVQATEFLASDTRTLSALVGGELDVTGTLDLPRIAGSVEVTEATYRFPDSRRSGRLSAVPLTDEDWATLQARFGISRPDPEEASRWLPRDAVLDVGIRLGRNIWIRKDFAPEMAIQFTGDLTVTKASEEDELQLQGEIQAISQRSYVEEFGRRFDVAEGTVRLNGPVREARLSATAEYSVPHRDEEDPVTIQLSVNGGQEDLALTLSSDPSMDNADIVSYLATGRPANAAFSGEGTSARDIGIDLVASQVTGSLERFAQEEVGLDVVQIQQDGLQGTTLVAGKYVTPRLFLGFRQGVNFQREDGRSFSENLSADAEAEYQALEWLMVSVRGGTSAIRFFLEGSYGW